LFINKEYETAKEYYGKAMMKLKFKIKGEKNGLLSTKLGQIYTTSEEYEKAIYSYS
jgi:hypothetical protein